MKPENSTNWRSDFFNTTPIYNDLKTFLENLSLHSWPDNDQLTRLLRQNLHPLSKPKTLQFVSQSLLDASTLYYEEYIYQHNQIPTRENNWHDFFNAMVWLTFTETKRAINALHISELKNQNDRKTRTRRRDALTLFDESGMIFVTAETELADALINHQWQSLFCDHSDQWGTSCTAFITGHALYEKALAPYIGMTGQALIILVENDFFQHNRTTQIQTIDQQISKQLLNDKWLIQPGDLSPLPLLGIPGWHPDQTADFYSNVAYFRPRKPS